ncbi:hypothetical protein SLV14_003625 [Streptomyces sp. Je 1-4]|uniref:hypothetical protein n=1 Tax=Streptomyces TaxID=1883 RepID=UPI0021D9EF27|nr:MULTISPECIES: hypothetical protein [unclassified Streptomyces]UYB40947.1 hypothetical protein SLV14_003625 [Streptomyces sp. Je 1-4]UZQ37107.1 hypothetical protein SLV14N_003625 [Streptomyces sp. Je 1-4] [Streptomyces sp. Je 1-4 4N24]UZQ44524.1 hypothetical protein SLV14NA_003625 [Streptomyces sp. Je 1-4] [Streptomyces sp. Je 1-4 4N24_ara]
MDPQLTAMAQTASATVVALMATDVWQHTRDGVVALWRRVRPGQAEEVGTELEVTRAEILAARQDGDTLGEQALAGEWQGRLRRLLIADPDTAHELLRILEESRALLPPGQEIQAPVVHMRAEVSGSGRVYQAGRDQHITER